MGEDAGLSPVLAAFVVRVGLLHRPEGALPARLARTGDLQLAGLIHLRFGRNLGIGPE